ncbi:glycoside hydrolase family 97 catalytic domain-containing protein [Stenotrophomonas sp. NPDC087984]
MSPGTYVGVWWELQRRHTTWTAGPRHRATTERVKRYIDLAREAGASSVLAEGWNTHAGGQWTGQDFLTPQPDFDLPEVLRYARANGVGFTAHNETRGFVDYYEQHLDTIFARYAELGIHSVKTGYATRFELGGVNRSHFDQEAVRHYQRVVDTAARYQIT